jgi:hypothetical protein
MPETTENSAIWVEPRDPDALCDPNRAAERAYPTTTVLEKGPEPRRHHHLPRVRICGVFPVQFAESRVYSASLRRIRSGELGTG